LALSALFAGVEVVPLTLLTRDNWDFVKKLIRTNQQQPRLSPTAVGCFFLAIFFES
jgi:nitric oxide reductase large subunit